MAPIESRHECAAATVELRERILGTDAAAAVGRFSLAGVSGYRARSGGPLRATRAEAESDEREHLDAVFDYEPRARKACSRCRRVRLTTRVLAPAVQWLCNDCLVVASRA